MKLTRNTILITCSATGVGLALAKRLSDGNEVIICGRDEAALRKAKAEVPELVTRICDVADTFSCHAMVESPQLNTRTSM
jgi:uncharacterized oxidoreductase